MLDLFALDLRLFDGEGEGAAAATGGEPEGAAGPDAVEQRPDSSMEARTPPEGARPAFDELIKGAYKEEYEKRVKAQLDRRFKAQEAILQRQKALEPAIELLARRYGVEPGDVQALVKAIESEANAEGAPVEDEEAELDGLKREKQLQRENFALQRIAQQQQSQRQAQRIYDKWMRETQEAQRLYPGLDFHQEAQSEDFLRLLRAGVNVRAAYEVMHRDDIIGGAMRYTAQQVASKVAGDIRARGARPQENGAGSSAASARSLRAVELNTREVRELAQRAKKGIKTRFE